MTITSDILRKDYTANGVNTTFAVDFPIFYESNATPKFSLEVITTDTSGIETNKTETTDYTITYTTIEFGIIPICNVVFNTAPINGHKVSILRKVNLTQNAEFTESSTEKYSGKAVESALDKLTLQILQIQENLNRVVRLAKSSSLTNIEFPINASVADEVICVNSAGNNLTTKNLADVSLAPVSTYIKTLLDDTTASQARTTLDAQQLNSNLSALAGLTGASNKIPMFSGAGAMTLTDKINPATTTVQGIVLAPIQTITKYTSGSGTYTLPANCKYLKIRMVGAGGGGAGSGSGGGTGGTGGSTTFGSSFLTCTGGTGGSNNGALGGSGGSGTINAGASGTALSGGYGQAGFTTSVASTNPCGGMGGTSVFGGAGSGANGNSGGAGGSAVSNTGGGGGGAGCTASGTFAGAGGGAGGFIDAIIASPSATYSYSVGPGGTSGTAGSSGFVGGVGGSGYIEITEYYY